MTYVYIYLIIILRIKNLIRKLKGKEKRDQKESQKGVFVSPFLREEFSKGQIGSFCGALNDP
jgi:hypothetical protein